MRIKENSWIKTQPVAHRGLWGENAVENSLTAYKKAVEKGYPVEIDLFLTTDKETVCFHDDDLFRMTGEKGLIYEKSLSELKNLSLLGSDEKIPTLKEVLSLVKGKIPLLIEIKNQPKGKELVDKTVEILKNYQGEFALQSFNPLYIKRIKKLAPEFIRGVLSDKKVELKNKFSRYIVRRMALNFLIKPDFLSLSVESLPIRKFKRKNKTVLTWTVTDEKTYEKVKPFSDNVIFENFIPKD